MVFQYATHILAYPFKKEAIAQLNKEKFGRKWPLVYIIENDDKQLAYIGETTNIVTRTGQHLSTPVRNNLKSIHIIYNEAFNKSVSLDLETFLIKYMAADGKYKLQNGNGGQQVHNYYQRSSYQNEFRAIWQQLQKYGLVCNDIRVIENTDLFKYSPYKTLTSDQYDTIQQVVQHLKEDISNNIPARSSVIIGGAGTGKSVLGTFLIKLLTDAQDKPEWTIEEDALNENLNAIIDKLPKLKIGYVVPMKNFRTTLKKVFKNIHGLRSSMVLSPAQVANSKETFDLLIVDESHRLRRRRNLSGPGDYIAFDKKNKMLGLGKEGTELDWILKKSRFQFFFYDAGQTIKPTDIPKEKFDSLLANADTYKYRLISQLRCKGGNDYIQYLHDIFDGENPSKISFKNYEFKLYENIDDMVKTIIQKDKELGLCRNIAGYAWEWKTKNKTLSEINKENSHDIEIDGYQYIWNSVDADWINSPHSSNEVGCIHTTQGFDLNFAGVILGPEIGYDTTNHKIIINKKLYKDTKGQSGISKDEELLAYIKNIYITLLERGIQGTYVYACDPDLRNYLKKFLEVIPYTSETQQNTITIYNDPEIPAEKRFIEFLPLYSLKAACGHFGQGEEVTTKGWIKIPERIHRDQSLFVVQAIGDSMEPVISEGDYCIFRANPQGTRQGKIVLTQHFSVPEPETGGSYTIKEYYSEKIINKDATWSHTKILLKSLNSKYSPIVIDEASAEDFKIIGELIHTIKPCPKQ